VDLALAVMIQSRPSFYGIAYRRPMALSMLLGLPASDPHPYGDDLLSEDSRDLGFEPWQSAARRCGPWLSGCAARATSNRAECGA